MSVPQSSIVIVPARFGSTRFPGKPLAQLGGQTVIERVVRQVLQAKVSRPVLIATDDARISNAIGAAFDFREVEAVMTSAECRTGTDRLAEVVRARVSPQELKQTLIINVQGDEPFVSPSHLDALLELMQDANLRMGTLAVPLSDSLMQNPNIVKVVCDAKQRALYFSRAPIPFLRDESLPRRTPLLRHLGLYAYRADWLLQLAGMPSSLLEDDEKLEQLRALEAGEPIGVAVVALGPDIAIDTPDDLERAREFLARSS